MKNIVFAIIAFLFIGCNSTEDNTSFVPAGGELYNKSDIILFGNISTFSFLDRYFQSQIISSNTQLNQIIDDLNKAQTFENDKDNGIHKEKKAKWLNALNSTNVDFSKDNLLLSTFRWGIIFDINIVEKNIEKNKKILFKKADPMGKGSTSEIGYIFIYKLPKDVKKITIELFPSSSKGENFTFANNQD